MFPRMAKLSKPTRAERRAPLNWYVKQVEQISAMEDVLWPTLQSNATAVSEAIRMMREREAQIPERTGKDRDFQSILKDLFMMKDQLRQLNKTASGLRRKIKRTGGAFFERPIDAEFIVRSVRAQKKILVQMLRFAGELSRKRTEMLRRLETIDARINGKKRRGKSVG
jgi:hypothetical protein